MSYQEQNGVWVPSGTEPVDPDAVPTMSVLDAIQMAFALDGGASSSSWRGPAGGTGATANPWRLDFFDGEQFPGGYGTTIDYVVDYEELRRRSEQLFTENLFAAGIVNKIATATVATGLQLEANPDELVLGREFGALSEWSDMVENKFGLYASSSQVCDFHERETFGLLQYTVFREALIGGDCLVVSHISPATGLPKIEVIKGADVQTPWPNEPRAGNRIEYGVEMDARGREVAYWVAQRDGGFKRVAAVGEKSKRRVAWLVTAVRRRAKEVRGRPLLQLVLQSLKEILTARTNVQRKMTVASLMAMFIERDVDAKTSTRPISGVAKKRGAAGTTTEYDRSQVDVIQRRLPPGLFIEGLGRGETIKAINPPSTASDTDFEKAILDGIAIGLEIPPEVFRMQYGSNFAAAQMAKNDYKFVLNAARDLFAEQFPRRVYRDWLIGKALRNQIDAPGFLQAFRQGLSGYEVFAAWTASNWSAPVHLSADLSRLGTGLKKLIDAGLMTRTRAAREATGQSFRTVVRQLQRENEQLAAANAPLTPVPDEREQT